MGGGEFPDGNSGFVAPLTGGVEVLVTDTGCEILDTFPFDEDLLFREV